VECVLTELWVELGTGIVQLWNAIYFLGPFYQNVICVLPNPLYWWAKIVSKRDFGKGWKGSVLGPSPDLERKIRWQAHRKLNLARKKDKQQGNVVQPRKIPWPCAPKVVFSYKPNPPSIWSKPKKILSEFCLLKLQNFAQVRGCFKQRLASVAI
jgi:hypothetical protein